MSVANRVKKLIDFFPHIVYNTSRRSKSASRPNGFFKEFESTKRDNLLRLPYENAVRGGSI
jgi:hypothetical protein